MERDAGSKIISPLHPFHKRGEPKGKEQVLSEKRFIDKTIGVLMGGLSTERDVSLKTGEAIADALERLAYRQKPVIVDRDIAFKLRDEAIDVAFIALHGRYGEDGAIQGLLEVMQIPYTGSGISASALAMNKVRSRDVFRAHQIPTPPSVTLTEAEAHAFRRDQMVFDFPVVVKPAAEGSSIGVTLVKDPRQIDEALEAALNYGHQIIVEKYISGMEVHVGILEDTALGAIEIRPKGPFYDYSAKYIPGMSDHIFPAPLLPKVYQTVLDLGLKAHRALGCSGYSRADFLVDEAGSPYLLEVNSLPGMTETSLMPEMARGVGIDFDTLVERILHAAATKV